MRTQLLRTDYAANALADTLEGRHADVLGVGEPHQLLDVGRSRHFNRDREIYRDGDNADHIFKVTVGVVRTYKFLRDGRRHVEAFYHKGAVFGLELGGRYSHSAAAASDCAVISYRRSSLPMFSLHNERSLLQLLSSALGYLAEARKHSMSLGCRSAIEKLAMFLIAIDSRDDESSEVSVGMTRMDIADYLGLTIETVSRTFAELEHRSLIELHGARQVRLVNKAGLRELCL